MPKMTEDQFIAMMAALVDTLEARDSMEGTISWCWTDEAGVYNVTGMYRVGNSDGQGGCVLLRSEEPAPDEPEETEEQTPTEHIPGALV